MSQPESEPRDSPAKLALDRTEMASYRTALALDRTTLAWVRTTLTMASFGFGMVAFFRTLVEKSPGSASTRLHEGAIRMGTGLIVLGLVATVLAGVAHWSTLRKLRRREDVEVSQWPLSLAVALFFALIGLAGLWEIFAG